MCSAMSSSLRRRIASLLVMRTGWSCCLRPPLRTQFLVSTDDVDPTGLDDVWVDLIAAMPDAHNGEFRFGKRDGGAHLVWAEASCGATATYVESDL